MMFRISVFVASLLALTTSAQAHTGVGDTHGLVHGFIHPIGGIDHVLVMVAVGLFAVHLGGRALWLLPLSFVSMMVVGGACGMAAIGLPGIEIGIGLSVVILGIALAAGYRIPVAAAMAMVGVFAVFHGHAHGTEMPESASGVAYGIGFVLATLMLHLCGIELGLGLGRLGELRRPRILRIAGSAMALAGFAILTGHL
jgi:urease accessory protein